MSEAVAGAAAAIKAPSIGTFERYLTVWAELAPETACRLTEHQREQAGDTSGLR